jgi:hypothetical protein
MESKLAGDYLVVTCLHFCSVALVYSPKEAEEPGVAGGLCLP